MNTFAATSAASASSLGMTLTEGFVRGEIFIDFGSDILYGEDQVFDTYPCRFPTVSFQLMATHGLSQIADRIRKDSSFKPMHPMDEYTSETCDNEGFYEFFISLNGYAEDHMDRCLEFVVVNSDSEDNEETYPIYLTGDERIAVYNRLDEQCRQYLGKGCEELLATAQQIMEEQPLD